MKKWEIEKTKPNFIISTFKTDIIRVGLVFSISNCFIKKSYLANEWMSFSYSNSALEQFFLTVGQSNFGNKIPILFVLSSFSKLLQIMPISLSTAAVYCLLPTRKVKHIDTNSAFPQFSME